MLLPDKMKNKLTKLRNKQIKDCELISEFTNNEFIW